LIGKEVKKWKVFQTKDSVSFRVVMRSIHGFTVQDDAVQVGIDKSQGVSIPGNARSRHTRTASEKSQTILSTASVGSSFSSTKPIKKLTESEEESNCFLFGYQVIPSDSDNKCEVQVISHFSNELQKLEIDFSFCRKLKLFIEELTLLTDSHEHQESRKNLFTDIDDKVRNKIVLFEYSFRLI
jgi:endo-1,4-beta-mannosidase